MPFAVPEVLVDTDWVAQHASDASVRIVEVDVDTTAYDQGHVPGAAGWNWTTELCDTLTRDIAPKDKLEALLGATGIDNQTTIVLYGDNNNWFAAWAFWQLKIYGHADVRIMDGGRKKWLAEGRELSTETSGVPGQDLPRARPRLLAPGVSCPKCRRHRRQGRRRSSTCAALRNSPARSLRLPDCPKPASAAATSPAPPASLGEGVQRRRDLQELSRS